jgi:hypothetical protein
LACTTDSGGLGERCDKPSVIRRHHRECG